MKKLRLVPLVFLAVFLVFFRPTFLLGDTSYIIVLGDSMEPTIPVGSLVVAKPLGNSYREGDIIAFRTPYGDAVMIHRVHEVVYDSDGNLMGYRTKGDAYPNPDGWTIEPDMVLGRMLVAIPYLGYTAIFLRNPVGLALVLILSFFVIVTPSELIMLIKKKRS